MVMWLIGLKSDTQAGDWQYVVFILKLILSIATRVSDDSLPASPRSYMT